MPRAPLRMALALVAPIALLWAAGAAAESSLRLDWPGMTGVTPAVTYDAERHNVGAAEVRIERTPDGNLSLRSVSGFTGGERTQLHAILEPVDDGARLRPIWQQSRSFDAQQHELGRLSIDHRAGHARCFDPSGELLAELPLPAEDRVANVTLNLLFMPLVRGEAEEVRFDLFFCGLGFRFVPFSATLAPVARNARTDKLVEVRYGPDFGIASFVARAMIPKLSIWFAPDEPHVWMGHRLPLYGNGPEVFVVRKGVPTGWLGAD